MRISPPTYSVEKIIALRTRAQLTQEDFARALGVRGSTVSRWEIGQYRPSWLAMKALIRLEAELNAEEKETREE